jgi:hypothetical protein
MPSPRSSASSQEMRTMSLVRNISCIVPGALRGLLDRSAARLLCSRGPCEASR